MIQLYHRFVDGSTLPAARVFELSSDNQIDHAKYTLVGLGVYQHLQSDKYNIRGRGLRLFFALPFRCASEHEFLTLSRNELTDDRPALTSCFDETCRKADELYVSRTGL